MTHHFRRIVGRALAVATAAALAGGLAACSSDVKSPPATITAAATVTVSDAWIKESDSGMTAMFATVKNGTKETVTVTGATTDLSPVEMHETTTDTAGNATMSALAGGLEIPPGKTVAFEPGGYHFMLTDLSGPVEAGDTYEVTILLSNGTEIQVSAQGRSYAGAQETYAGTLPTSMATPAAS